MANITIHEFFEEPTAERDVRFPAKVTNTVTHADTYTLREETQFIYVTVSAACRMLISTDGSAASDSGMNLIETVPNPFYLDGAAARILTFSL